MAARLLRRKNRNDYQPTVSISITVVLCGRVRRSVTGAPTSAFGYAAAALGSQRGEDACGKPCGATLGYRQARRRNRPSTARTACAATIAAERGGTMADTGAKDLLLQKRCFNDSANDENAQ
jgi:hypothetical protein